MKMWRCRAQGFSLIEIAIVLVILGLLLGGMLMPLSAQMEQRRVAETQKVLEEINQALIGFAVVNGWLPCPDTNGDGQENRTGAACTNQEGVLPWATLGVAETDAWGNRFRYRVTAVFSNNATPLFTLASNGDISVKNAVAGANVATALPALILSHGRNGLGATNQAGGTNAAPTGADELANTDGDTTFVSHPSSGAGATGGEFDDIVVWMSPNILFNRMVTASKLP